MPTPISEFKNSVQKRNKNNAAVVNLEVKVPRLNVNQIFTVILDTSDINFHKVTINWDDSGFEDFRDDGLYMQYSTQYQEMNYNPNYDALTIIDSNGEEIIILNR